MRPDVGAASLTRTAGAPAPRQSGTAPLRNAAGYINVEAVPEGTDAELWAVLTPEERAFFARTASVSAPTYGRGGALPVRSAPATVRRGLHLDLRA